MLALKTRLVSAPFRTGTGAGAGALMNKLSSPARGVASATRPADDAEKTVFLSGIPPRTPYSALNELAPGPLLAAMRTVPGTQKGHWVAYLTFNDAQKATEYAQKWAKQPPTLGGIPAAHTGLAHGVPLSRHSAATTKIAITGPSANELTEERVKAFGAYSAFSRGDGWIDLEYPTIAETYAALVAARKSPEVIQSKLRVATTSRRPPPQGQTNTVRLFAHTNTPWTRESLTQAASAFGEVVLVQVAKPKLRETKPTQRALIQFKDTASAAKCIAGLSALPTYKDVKTRFAREVDELPAVPAARAICIHRKPEDPQYDDAQLREDAKPFGELVEMRFAHKRTRAYLVFANAESAARAYEALGAKYDRVVYANAWKAVRNPAGAGEVVV
ncbi:hypothetical protein MKEN_00746700 [Mycena kentingensis (nom. inval.)]|nr:hypothetical protein MKEN_00746700 [Mycena kentingensis (nom. inval.)]